jgi:hypothetical protein
MEALRKAWGLRASESSLEDISDELWGPWDDEERVFIDKHKRAKHHFRAQRQAEPINYQSAYIFDASPTAFSFPLIHIHTSSSPHGRRLPAHAHGTARPWAWRRSSRRRHHPRQVCYPSQKPGTSLTIHCSGEVIHISSLALLKVTAPIIVSSSNLCSIPPPFFSDAQAWEGRSTHGSHGPHAGRIRR